ncbi:MAG: Uma2 family endonuclease [Gemmataceae bacterium]
MTAEEFQAFVERPENVGRWFELVRGEVIELPPPRTPHGVVASRVNFYLTLYTETVGRFFVTSNDAGGRLERGPDTVRGPDVAVYNGTRAFDELPEKYMQEPPLLAVEVLSPHDKHPNVLREVSEYLRAGTKIVWLADPETRTVMIYRPDEFPAVADEQDTLSGHDTLPELTVRVADLFRLPRERTHP